MAVDERPRKIIMPTSFNPEFLFTGINSKSIMNKIKGNLDSISDPDKRPSIRVVRWRSKFVAEVKDLCRIELVQISGIHLKGQGLGETQFVDYGQKNMYMVLNTTIGAFDNAPQSFARYNRVCKFAVKGIE